MHCASQVKYSATSHNLLTSICDSLDLLLLSHQLLKAQPSQPTVTKFSVR